MCSPSRNRPAEERAGGSGGEGDSSGASLTLSLSRHRCYYAIAICRNGISTSAIFIELPLYLEACQNTETDRVSEHHLEIGGSLLYD